MIESWNNKAFFHTLAHMISTGLTTTQDTHHWGLFSWESPPVALRTEEAYWMRCEMSSQS